MLELPEPGSTAPVSDTDDADDDAPGDGGLDRRGLLALGLVLAVLAVCGVVLLTGGEDAPVTDDDATGATSTAAEEDGDGSGATTTVADEESTTVDTSRAAVLEGVADGLHRGSDGVISREEATCMAEALVNHLGVGRLIELGDQARGTPDALNPLAALPRAEQDAAVAVMLPCADEETRARIDPNAR